MGGGSRGVIALSAKIPVKGYGLIHACRGTATGMANGTW